jgi:energy-converting hydrogenase Eha subunit E
MSPVFLTLDAISVAVFVFIGRASHHEGASGFVHTAAPFFIGLVAGWLVMRAWRNPRGMGVGLGVTVATVAVGISLRRLVFSDGIALTFVVVATAFLTLFLMGWRVVADRLSRT